MCGRLQVWLVVVLGVAVFATFMACRPACSTANRLHNRPVPAFKALSADVYVKSGIGTRVKVAVTRPAAALISLQPEQPVVADDQPTIVAPGDRSLLCCLLC